MFLMLSESKFFNDKIDLFIALAPIVYLGNCQEVAFQTAASLWVEIYTASKVLNFYEINDAFFHLNKVFCTNFKDFCNFVSYLIHG